MFNKGDNMGDKPYESEVDYRNQEDANSKCNNDGEVTKNCLSQSETTDPKESTTNCRLYRERRVIRTVENTNVVKEYCVKGHIPQCDQQRRYGKLNEVENRTKIYTSQVKFNVSIGMWNIQGIQNKHTNK